VAGAVERGVDPGDELLAAELVAHLPDALQPRGPLLVAVAVGEDQPPADDLEEELARVVEGERLRVGLQRQAREGERGEGGDEDLVERVDVAQHLLPKLALDLLREGVARAKVAQQVGHRHHAAARPPAPVRPEEACAAAAACGGRGCSCWRGEGEPERHWIWWKRTTEQWMAGSGRSWEWIVAGVAFLNLLSSSSSFYYSSPFCNSNATHSCHLLPPSQIEKKSNITPSHIRDNLHNSLNFKTRYFTH